MPSANKKPNNSSHSKESSENTSSLPIGENRFFEGDSLPLLLNSISRVIESEREGNKGAPDKFWFKQQFAIGVNEVTRALERTVPHENENIVTPFPSHRRFAATVKLQVVLVSSDCNPRWLIKHLPSLAASRGVPIIHVKEKKEGSLRLGELVKIKTAIAIGVKAKGNAINKLFEEILSDEIQNSCREISADTPSFVPESAALPLYSSST